MGRGDKRSKRGKISRGSFGKTRMRISKLVKAVVAPVKEVVEKLEAAAPKKKAATKAKTAK